MTTNTPIVYLFIGLIVTLWFASWIRGAIRIPWRVRRAHSVLRRLRAFQGEYANAQRFAYLRKIDPFVFEELVTLCFRERGCRTKSSPYTRDGGIDGTLWLPDGREVLIQSKRYRKHIQRQHVADFVQLLQRRAKLGVFVHTGRTGQASRQAAQNPSIQILSGQRLLQLIIGEPLQIFGVSIPAHDSCALPLQQIPRMTDVSK